MPSVGDVPGHACTCHVYSLNRRGMLHAVSLLLQVLLTHSLPTRCAFSNPSSPYGLTRLPLAPEEDRVVKARDKTTPQIVAKVSCHGSICACACACVGTPCCSAMNGAAGMVSIFLRTYCLLVSIPRPVLTGSPS